MTAKKTPAPAPVRRLRWLGGAEPERYIPGVPARDLEESDIARLEWLRSTLGDAAAPAPSALVASGLYSTPDVPRENTRNHATPEVPAPSADVPATTPEE
jgi:hypothetical protein